MSTRNAAGGKRFPKCARLRRRREFLAVQHKASGKVHSKHFLVLLASTTRQQDAASRIGITVSKKVGTAVKRNRIKRLVREFVRHQGADWIPTARDVVIIAKRSAASISGLDELAADLGPIARRLQRC